MMRMFQVYLLLLTMQMFPATDAHSQTDPRAARETWLRSAASRPRNLKSTPPTQQSIASGPSNWQALGTGLSGYGEALTTSDSTLWVGGIFLQAGGQQSQGIARWNGSWSGVGGGTNGFVYAVVVRGSNVYVAGQFTVVGGTMSANNIARWDGSSWHALGSGLTKPGGSASVLALAFKDTVLYAGGSFTRADGLSASNLARWNGTSWEAVPSAPTGTVSALAADTGSLYVGGAFTSVAGIPGTRHLARWTGSQWSGIGGGPNNTVLAIAFQGSSVLVGGFFDSVGTIKARCIGRWTGTTWESVGYGLRNSVNAIAPVGDGSIYAGGNFDYKYTATDSVPIGYMAVWRDGDWQPLETGLDGPANSLAYENGDLFVTGYFVTAGGMTVNGVALWQERTETVYRQGWNLVSMPRLPRSTDPESVFPGTLGVYRFVSGAYSRPPAIELGRGYWALYPSQTTNIVTGTLSDSASISITSSNSWALVGALTQSAPLSAIATTPPNSLIQGLVYDYNGTSYVPAATLEPGHGYWVYVLQPCVIHLVNH